MLSDQRATLRRRQSASHSVASPQSCYPWVVVALRVSRRNAFAAAAGWVAASARPAADWRCGGTDAHQAIAAGDAGAAAGRGRVFVLYRALARFLRDPDPDRRAAMTRALGRRLRLATAAYGRDLVDYLLDQVEGLGPEAARWAAAADAADVPGQVRNGLARARALLAADADPAVFLIFSRRFDGRADGRCIFFGVDRFGTDRLRDQVALLTAHEYNHIVRAQVAPFATLLDAVVAEGLATACSALAEPGRPLADYLLFPPEQLTWYTPERLAQLWADLAAAAGSRSPTRRSAYLHSGCPGPHGAPPRSGYVLGYLIIRAWLERGASIAALTRMPTAAIWAGFGRMRDER